MPFAYVPPGSSQEVIVTNLYHYKIREIYKKRKRIYKKNYYIKKLNILFFNFFVKNVVKSQKIVIFGHFWGV